MTKTVAGALATLLAASPKQLCRFVTITLTGSPSTPFRFTDATSDLFVTALSDTFLASNAVRVRAIEASNGSVAQNTELAIKYVDGLSRTAAIQGTYDNALVEVDIGSWADPDAGFVRLITGFLQRRNSSSDLQGDWGVKGLLKLADGVLGEVFSQECRNNLGDERCQLSLATSLFTQTATVIAVQEDFVQFDVNIPNTVPDEAAESGYFSFGLVKFTGAQFYIEVLHSEDLGSDNHRLTLAIPTDTSIGVTDTLELIVGCDKRHFTCVNKFANIEQAQMEPFAPLEDNAKEIV